jgi:DNA-binding TFAR19-related protein (PDSD5 family)
LALIFRASIHSKYELPDVKKYKKLKKSARKKLSPSARYLLCRTRKAIRNSAMYVFTSNTKIVTNERVKELFNEQELVASLKAITRDRRTNAITFPLPRLFLKEKLKDRIETRAINELKPNLVK